MRPFDPGPLIVYATEAQVQAAIVEMGIYLGYRSYHETDSRKSERGFPDLTMVGIGQYRQIVYVEVKRDPRDGTKGEIRATSPKVEQVDWLETLRESGHHAVVVRGSQIDILEKILRMEYPPPGGGVLHPDLELLLANEENPVVVPVRVRKEKRGRRNF